MPDGSNDRENDARDELPMIGERPGQSFADCCGADDGSSCSSSLDLGFEGFTVTSEGAEDDAEAMRSAWRATLAREGKLHPEGKSLRDLMMKGAGIGDAGTSSPPLS
jgi:hypothetical protein